MKRTQAIVFILLVTRLWSVSISLDRANQLASVKAKQLYASNSIEYCESLYGSQGELLAYVYHLNPTGYMVIGAREELPPLYAYSGSSSYVNVNGFNPMKDIAIADLSNRLQNEAEAQRNRIAWQNAFQSYRIEQWPPVGYSNTEGWVKTLWTQSYPYNMMCPMDTVTGSRSIAGCPAIAMGQIVNYHKTLNGTRFSDADDYHHQYSGRNYWVDNDFATVGFPSYPQLNSYLDEINYRYRYQEDLNDSLNAALVFAAGSAMRQVYTSSGSGTFAVNQAYEGLQKFGFSSSELVTQTSPELYARMAQNMKDALPVLYAVVTPAWDSGHNVVVDGYNENNYFHVNFGWGGANNGWLLLPQQMPYNLTVLEGAVVDIKPLDCVFTVPDTLDFSLQSNQILEIYNLQDETVTVEDLLVGAGLDRVEWIMLPQIPLPAPIPANCTLTFEISFNNHLQLTSLAGNLRLILNSSVVEIPVRYESCTSINDEALTPSLGSVSVYPNPFSTSCTIQWEGKSNRMLTLEVFNIRGQKLYTEDLLSNLPTTTFNWKGTDNRGKPQSTGIYLYRITDGITSSSGKLLKLR